MVGFYDVLYALGITPWEGMSLLPLGGQVAAMLDVEQAHRTRPYGSVLDLGCGSGTWSVELAKRGWDVTGVDFVPQALRAAAKRAADAAVALRLVQGDMTSLGADELGSGFDLVLDLGTTHGFSPAQRAMVGRLVGELAAERATLIVMAFAPARRLVLPRGMSREEIERLYPGWTVTLEQPQDPTGVPRPVRRAKPCWYRLQR